MKQNSVKTTLFFVVSAFFILLSVPVKAQIKLVESGKSTFTIIIPADAVTSLRSAAQELQKNLELATDANLPVQKDNVKVSGAFISLGSTEQAKSAGLSSEKMADESYRIVTRGGNLYILGPDTPEGDWTEKGGVSNGTANGVYTFLEDYLNVRWLMPGDIGRDVPRRSTFALENIDRTEIPKFNRRTMRYLYDYADARQYANIRDWMEHQRLGASAAFNSTHNWWQTISHGYGGERSSDPNNAAVRKAYEEHPEWFAMDKDGNRPLPTGSKAHYAKLETTNQELVRWFAQQAIESLKSSKRPMTFSLSPSDGSAWSQSPESKALYDPNPSALFDPEVADGDASMSSLVLKWYHDIAEIVAKEYPEGRVSGFIYSSYVFPPQKVSAKLPDNFTPMICGIGTYGYGLYRPENQERWRHVMDSWADIVTGDWYYYDLPIHLSRQSRHAITDRGGNGNFPGNTGIVTPAAPDILDVIFPQLVKSRIDGALFYGLTSWSSSALSNYLLAKLQWDPTLSAHELQKEWLHRAYGPEAGAAMETFYGRLNDLFRVYYQENERTSYELTPGMFQNLYGTYYAELEKLFLQAKAQPMSEIQKRRLQLIEDNLIVLQWRLRNASFLSPDFVSPLQRSDIEINDLVAQDNPDFPVFPGATTPSMGNTQRKVKPLPWKVLVAKESVSKSKSTLPKWDDGEILIHAARDGDIQITTKMVTHGAYFAGYEVEDQKGKLVASGIFNTERPITIPARAGETYKLSIPLRKPANFHLQIKNAVVANAHLQDGTLHLSGEDAPVYVLYIPGKEPVGVSRGSNTSVTIRKPYSGYAAESHAERRFSDVRQLDVFDEGWLFSPDPENDGIERGVLEANFDDSGWAAISPLNWWQNQGFPDYYGPAWYRIKFNAEELQKGETARFYFGAIDGNAVIYLNGKKIKEHTLGPNFEGWDKAFTLKATNAVLPGENILAVQVTSKNDTTASGIFKGVAFIMGMQR